MSVLLIAGSPTAPSRSTALLDAAALRLQRRGLAVQRLVVRELPAQALLHADFGNAQVQEAIHSVAAAQVVIVATPVYKAAYSGLLKTFLDLLPQAAFKGKTVLPLATGGSPHHMLALDYALRPVLGALGAGHILPGVYASDAQVTLTPEGAYQLQVDIADRLAEAVDTLLAEALPSASCSGFEPVHFSRVRCSV
ncbi:NADPH-dependent FMN reductase [Xenophilus sp. Marseille-Q4582]|uniref:NADPH-dependent FMN reductase n=1 Tax=Xenophilus sp. Marseille-Q4582 TaxID=2866600 RepID=UPI001CE4A4AA|nr:NADPH-dependent FMN reductase [Xenophilus sp. Marseille-Q4582]